MGFQNSEHLYLAIIVHRENLDDPQLRAAWVFVVIFVTVL